MFQPDVGQESSLTRIEQRTFVSHGPLWTHGTNLLAPLGALYLVDIKHLKSANRFVTCAINRIGYLWAGVYSTLAQRYPIPFIDPRYYIHP